MSDYNPVLAYHFVGKALRDGRPVPTDGEWLSHAGNIRICAEGLHASEHPLDAVRYAPGNTLCLVWLAGRCARQDDKLCAEHRYIVARFDATELLRAFARECALSVIDKWNAPAIVREYLETGDESKRIPARQAAAAAYAADAAADAAAYAAAAAAYAAAADAYAAAYAAADARKQARQRYRARFLEMVADKFRSMGVIA